MDYRSKEEVVVVKPGIRTVLVTVEIFDDDVEDDDERFKVILYGPTGDLVLHPKKHIALGTIRNREVGSALTAEFPPSPSASASHTGASDLPQVVVAFGKPVAAFGKDTASVEVTGGAVEGVQRHTESGLANAWLFQVRPSGDGAVSFRLVAGVACDAGGICTEDGERLAEAPGTRTIPGPGTAAPVTATLAVEDDEAGSFDVSVAFSGAVTGLGALDLTAGHVGGGPAAVTGIEEAEAGLKWSARVATAGAGRMWVRAGAVEAVSGGSSRPATLVVDVDAGATRRR